MSIKKIWRSVEVRRPLKLYLEVEQGEASTGIVEVATASAWVERIQGRQRLEHKQ